LENVNVKTDPHVAVISGEKGKKGTSDSNAGGPEGGERGRPGVHLGKLAHRKTRALNLGSFRMGHNIASSRGRGRNLRRRTVVGAGRDKKNVF